MVIGLVRYFMCCTDGCSGLLVYITRGDYI